jgi:hypothetical protein
LKIEKTKIKVIPKTLTLEDDVYFNDRLIIKEVGDEIVFAAEIDNTGNIFTMKKKDLELFLRMK